MYRFNVLPTTTLLVGTLLLVPSVAQAAPDLCDSVPSECEYTGPNAPLLEEAVCYDRNATPTVTLKGIGACATGSTEYFVQHGEVVSPTTGEVTGYVPLDWACDTPGLCDSNPPAGTESEAICCENGGGGDCWPATEVLCNSPGDILVMCEDGVTNQDGTVTCFEGE